MAYNDTDPTFRWRDPTSDRFLLFFSRARNNGRSKKRTMSGQTGKLTDQLFVLPVMLTGHIPSYWKWNKSKFSCCSVASVVTSVCCESLCIAELWSEILGEMRLDSRSHKIKNIFTFISSFSSSVMERNMDYRRSFRIKIRTPEIILFGGAGQN